MIRCDETCVYRDLGGGAEQALPWSQLSEVALLSVQDDVGLYFVLSAPDHKDLLVPYSEAVTDLIGRLQRLPGFDNSALLEATTADGPGRWTCWQRPPQAAPSPAVTSPPASAPATSVASVSTPAAAASNSAPRATSAPRSCRVGVQLHPQHASYQQLAAAARECDRLGVDSLWTWDHFFPLYGDPDGAHFEGWTLLTALAFEAPRTQVGHLVLCNSYRNPQLLADMTRTLDHVTGGRFILGLGSGWFERDYREYGYEFGTAPGRLKDLDRNLPIILERLGKLNPPPTRKIPIMIGGGGEKVTLRITAQYADMWNGFGPVDNFRHKNSVLSEWCGKLGRDPAAIDRSVLIDPKELERWQEYREAGATHLILGLNGPDYDLKAVEKLVNSVI